MTRNYTDEYFDLFHALQVLYGTYGVRASVEQKNKDLIKFGTNPAVGSSGRFTLWHTGQRITGDIQGYLATTNIDPLGQ